MQAAARAMQQFAWESAARLYQQVLQVVELREPVDERQRLEVLFELAQAQIRSGAGERAQATFSQAIELGRRLGATEAIASGISQQGNIVLTLNIPDREGLVRELLDQLPPGDSYIRVQLLRWVITWSFFETRDKRIALFNDVVAMARRLGDQRALVAVLGGRGFGLKDAYSPQERLDNAREFLELARTIDDNDFVLNALLQLHSAHLELGDVAAAAGVIDQMAQMAERLRTPFARWYVLVHRGLHAALKGDFAETERLADQTLPLGRMIWAQAVGEPDTIYARHLHLVRRERGGLEELVPLCQAIVEQHPYDLVRRSWPYFQTMIYTDLGWEAQARTLFEQVTADDFADLARRTEISITFYATLAVTCAYLGDVRRAARLYDHLLPRAGEAIAFFGVYTCYGAVDHYLGLLATTLERWDAAEQHFTAALALHERMGARPFAAHTRYAWAHMLAQHDEPDNRERAVAMLDDALATCEQLGMPVLAERALGLKVRLQGTLQA
jgi:tetratricopeptide (TPR) repeat protein